ncbi:MAG: hypothetical protein SOV62_00650 [Alloprevotella sp.]|nr:hypothetical protein [Alloprevotella sp.]
MKTISTLNWAFAAVFSALALTACNDDYLEVPGAANNDSKGFHTVRFEAAMQQQGAQDVARVAKPRTIIESTVDGYATKWAIGDIIDVFEVAYGVPVAATGTEGEAEASSTEDKSQKYASKALAAEDIDGSGKAVFSVDLANDNAGGTKYEYYAVYPHTSSAEGWEYESYIDISSAWTSETDDFYQWWKERWGYNGPYVEPHPTLMVELPWRQSPTADSFDPKADLMVSKTVTAAEQPTESMSLQFARLGCVIKITLKGLTDYVGQQITEAGFMFDDSYGGNLNAEFDPALNRYQYYKGMPQFTLKPQNVVVKADGTADLWIRAYEGQIKGWFRVDLTLTDGAVQTTQLARDVYLLKSGKTIDFHEGGLTQFGVSQFGVCDVENVSDLTHAVHDTRDGFTINWQGVENVSDYLCYYTYQDAVTYEQSDPIIISPQQTDAVANTWQGTVTGLSPNTYNISVMPIPDAGHALVDGGRASTTSAPVGVPVYESIPSRYFPSSIGETETEVDCETGIKVMAKNLYRSYDSTLGYALLPEVNTDWVIYSTTTPFKELAQYELYVSYTNEKAVTEAMQFYVTKTPGSLEGAVLVQPTSIETWDDMYKVIYDLPGGYTHFYIKGHHKSPSNVADDEEATYPFYISQNQYLYGYK